MDKTLIQYQRHLFAGRPHPAPNVADTRVKYITMDKGNHFEQLPTDHSRSPQYASIADAENSMVTGSQTVLSGCSYPSSSIALLSHQTQNGAPSYVNCTIFDKSWDGSENLTNRTERLNSLQEPLLSTRRPLYTFGDEHQKMDLRTSSKSSNISAISISELSDSVFPVSNH